LTEQISFSNQLFTKKIDFSQISTIVAAYNEEEGIIPTLTEIKDVLHDAEIVVVDGKSSDKTFELAKKFGAKVISQKGVGKGNAIAEGLKNLGDKTAYVIFTDADYTYPASYIEKMINILDVHPEVGMVLGNRFTEELKDQSDRNQFFIGNKILATIHNVMNGLNLEDPFTGLRIMRYEVLKSWVPQSQEFDIEAEINWFVNKSGYKIVEIPIHYRKRLGKKKLGFRHGLKILRRIVLNSFLID